MEDSEIIRLFFERSEQAIGELDKKYGAAATKTAANILQDRLDVEECVNDTYLGVWNSIPPHRPNPLVSYVCRITRNLAVSKLRSNAAVKRNSNFDLVFDPSVHFYEDENGKPCFFFTQYEDEILYQLAVDMGDTEPGDALEYMRDWIEFQKRFNQTLPMIPVYSNTYFDFYTNVLHDYMISENVTWGEAIVGTYVGDPITK